jgi:AcrR family transcriptional regulator
MPMEKITSQDIADHCGASRQTFYNHFHDKQAVIEWIFTSHFDDLSIELNDYDLWSVKAASVIEKDWWFYSKAIKTTDFWAWHEKWLFENMINYIRINYGQDKITEEVQLSLEIWLTGACKGFLGVISSRQGLSPVKISLLNRKNMPPILKEFFPYRGM